MEFLIQNWALLALIVSAFLSIFFIYELAEIILSPFKVVWLVLKLIFKFFKWVFGLFKKPANAYKQAKRLEKA